MVLVRAEKCPVVQKEIDEIGRDLTDGLILSSPQIMTVIGAILAWHRTEIHHGRTLTVMTRIVVSVEAGVEGAANIGVDSIRRLMVVETARTVIDGGIRTIVHRLRTIL